MSDFDFNPRGSSSLPSVKSSNIGGKGKYDIDLDSIVGSVSPTPQPQIQTQTQPQSQITNNDFFGSSSSQSNGGFSGFDNDTSFNSFNPTSQNNFSFSSTNQSSVGFGNSNLSFGNTSVSTSNVNLSSGNNSGSISQENDFEFSNFTSYQPSSNMSTFTSSFKPVTQASSPVQKPSPSFNEFEGFSSSQILSTPISQPNSSSFVSFDDFPSFEQTSLKPVAQTASVQTPQTSFPITKIPSSLVSNIPQTSFDLSNNRKSIPTQTQPIQTQPLPSVPTQQMMEQSLTEILCKVCTTKVPLDQLNKHSKTCQAPKKTELRQTPTPPQVSPSPSHENLAQLSTLSDFFKQEQEGQKTPQSLSNRNSLTLEKKVSQEIEPDDGVLRILCRVCNQKIPIDLLEDHSKQCESQILKKKEFKDIATVAPVIPSSPIIPPDRLFIVSTPKKKGNALTSYLSFSILTQETATKNVVNEVERKESDFEWLYLVLSQEFIERIIPPLPPKVKILQDQDEKFLQARRRYYQRFIQVILNHSELRRSEYFRNFVAAKPEDFKLIQDTFKKQPTGFFDAFSEKAKKMLSSRSSVPTDEKLEKAKAYFNDFLKSLTTLSQVLEKVETKQSELASTLPLLGNALPSITSSPTPGKPLEEALNSCLQSIAREWNDQIVCQSSNFTEALVFWIGYTKSALQLIGKYESAIDNVYYCKSTQEQLQAQLQADPSKSDQYLPKIQKATQKTQQAQQLVDKIGSNIYQEFAAFQQQRNASFKTMYTEFVKSQISFYSKVATSWQTVPF